MESHLKKFGTAPVFFTAISIIPGAILSHKNNGTPQGMAPWFDLHFERFVQARQSILVIELDLLQI